MTEMKSESVVVVAVKAEREISKAALTWALTHVVRPGDLVTLLAVLGDQKLSWRQRLLWGFPGFSGDNRSRRRQEERCQISASCSQMTLQMEGKNEINVRIKVVGSDSNLSSSTNEGVVAAESKKLGADWVILDKQLTNEEKQCMEELECNIVVMKGSFAKVLRLNLNGTNINRPCAPPISSPSMSCSTGSENNPDDRINQHYRSIANYPSISSTGRGSSVLVSEGSNPVYERFSRENISSKALVLSDEHVFDLDGNREISPISTNLGLEYHHNGARTDCILCPPVPSSFSLAYNYWNPQNYISEEAPHVESSKNNRSQPSQEKLSESDRDSLLKKLRLRQKLVAKGYLHPSGVKEVECLIETSLSIPPPLCSLCRHKAPVFGKPPREFTYRELEETTGGFSDVNFVAEGADGRIHKAVLADGQVVAVKQLKSYPSEPNCDEEFRKKLEILSRVQHRNVVVLVGFCAEERRRVLVYEYICNGSLDLHLHGQGKHPLDWHARVKIAFGVARGLRYLHEDCRVGFAIHRDMRPNNILLTHDFEPLVGDFSLTGWRTEASLSVHAQVAEAFGYLAPEYVEHGIITEESDVYSFGVILLELITGRRAMDVTRPKGQQFLVEWARPFLSFSSEGQTVSIDRFLDPCLDRNQVICFSWQLQAMANAASLCLRRDSQARPSMSKVLRLLEGNAFVDPGLDMNTTGSRSGRMNRPMMYQDNRPGSSVSLRFQHEVVLNKLHAQRGWPHYS